MFRRHRFWRRHWPHHMDEPMPGEGPHGGPGHPFREHGPGPERGPRGGFGPRPPFGFGPWGGGPRPPFGFGQRGGFGPRPPFGFGPRGGGPRGGGPFGPFGGGGPFGGDPFDEGGGGRRRHRRGDLKYVLLELVAEQPRHGYELIKVLEERYAGFYRPSPGSVYPTLQLLEDEGSVTSESVEGKRVYTITDAGRRLLEEHQQRGGGRPGGERPGPDRDLDALHRGAMALQASIMQVARHGTPEQRRAALERLDATRREIYRILAQDESESQV